MAVPAGVMAVLVSAGPAFAGAPGRGTAEAAIGRPGSRGASAALPATGDPAADDGSDHGKDKGAGKESPPEIRHRLEFTGAMGWPDFAMGCFFDPDSRGADRLGRRIVCVDAVARPPVFGPIRIRGHHRP